jgi:hypothetical protein
MGRSEGKKKLSKTDNRSRSVLLGEGNRHVGGAKKIAGLLRSQGDIFQERINNSSKKTKLAELGLTPEEVEQIFNSLKNDLEPLLSDSPILDQLIKVHNVLSQRAQEALDEIKRGGSFPSSFALLAIFDAKTNYKDLLGKFNQRWSNNQQGRIDYSDLINEIEANLQLINLIPGSNSSKHQASIKEQAVTSLASLLDLDINRGRSWALGHNAFKKGDFYENASQLFLNDDGTISFNNTKLKVGLNTIGPVDAGSVSHVELIEKRKNNSRLLTYLGDNKIGYKKDDGSKDKFSYEFEVTDLGNKLTFNFRAKFDNSPLFIKEGEIDHTDLKDFTSQESWALQKIHSMIFQALKINRR